ncbi:hypothetical protein FCV25MIE_15471 [Fagus crenata]
MPTSSTIITSMSTPHNNDPSPTPITSFSDPISPHSAPIPLSNDHVSDSTSSNLSPQSTSPTITVPVSASVPPSIPAHMSDSISALLPITHSSSGNPHPMTIRSKAESVRRNKFLWLILNPHLTISMLNCLPTPLLVSILNGMMP